MNRADERVLAWSLVDAAAPHLSPELRTGLTMKIGAGELDGAIVELMTFYGTTGTAISHALIHALETWIFGYTGTSDEARLRELLRRITLRPNDDHGPPSSAWTAIGVMT